jgi:purine catabolism regulator
MSNSVPPVNISDVLRLALPLQTAVIAGKDPARRTVQWVIVLTSWDNLPLQAQEGDLVILPLALQERISEKMLLQKLETLAELEVAGIVAFKTVSEQAIAEATRLDVPLLLAPPETSVREANRKVAAVLVDRQSATTERGLQLYRTLSEMSREEQGIPAMTEVISKLTGKIVVVQDKRLEVKAVSVPQNNSLDVEKITEMLMQREELPAGLRNRKAAARALQSHWQQMLPIENIGRLVSPIISGDRARGYLSVIGLADELDLLDQQAVEHGAAAFALEMAKAKAVSEARKALRGDFLEGVLAGTLPPREIERLASRLDHETSTPHAVMTFEWAGRNAPSLRRLESAVNWAFSSHGRAGLVHIYGGRHICIFQELRAEDDTESAPALGRRILEQIKTEFPKDNVIAGMSGPALSLADWPRIYNEALQAMQLSQRLQIQGEVVEFNSLGVYRLLGQLEDIPAVRAFTRQVVGPLIEYDGRHQSALLQTIDAYFNHHGNISQTAESLFIHRNTLLYRLERIQELTGHDLNQANMRLGLHLALKLWQLRSDK